MKTILAFVILSVPSVPLLADTMMFGDQDLFGFGYPGDPFVGATLEGLLPGETSQANNDIGHDFPFDPEIDDFPGTDQIYIASNQTSQNDGYSGYPNRQPGPQLLTLDYSPLLGFSKIETFTLGIAADDFQFPIFDDPFEAQVNGLVHPELTNLLNSLSQTGPDTRFVSIGLDPIILDPSNTLVVSIDNLGIGLDGWAVDFLTIGVTTTPILPGDVNGDDVVNLLDIDPFIAILAIGTYQLEADMNQDGVVNLLDVDGFIAAIAG